MTYQRGTDLKHCPDGCEHIGIEMFVMTGNEMLMCAATPADTCPREQYGDPTRICNTCKWWDALGCCEPDEATDYWKERTND